MKNDDTIFLARECCIEQFAREQAAGVWQHKDDRAEFAALRFMHGKSIGKFEDRIAFFPEVTTGEIVLEAGLRRELDLKFPAQVWEPLPSKETDDHADFTVGDVCGGIFLWINLAMLVPWEPRIGVYKVDDLVAVDDFLGSMGLGCLRCHPSLREASIIA